MIVYDLECLGAGHRFEGWFSSSVDFAAQAARGLVGCPQCGSLEVIKAPMAPRVSRKGNQVALASPKDAAAVSAASETPAAVQAPALPPEAVAAFRAMAAIQAEAIKHSRWVGDDFASESRAMHYGERDPATIHGQATREEAEALVDEGIAIVPLLFPVAPPDEVN
jgi:hypothetical protein